jgi:D-alanyl-D-alanine carboxypeptidase (penicillin-binding protein 5/6)
MCLVLMSSAALAEIESDLSEAMRSTIPPPKLKVSSWLLMDAATGQTLAAHGADTPVEPASLTKVMTP